ncbi:Pyrophosphatase PpaX [Sporomusa carbonis]
MLNILFWDIDGTLIRTSKAGLYAFRQATEELWGKSVDFADIATAGMTDNYIGRQVIQTVLEREASQDEIATLCRRYESILPEQLAAREGFVLPRVRNILSRLCEQDDYKLLLLTGNSKQGAHVKLRHFELEQYFDFACSAFSEQSEHRVEIARRALDIIRGHWGDPAQHNVYVIGDTPHDIECGKAIGAYTLGVATGAYSLDQLQNCSPWWAVETLPTPETFLAKLSSI